MSEPFSALTSTNGERPKQVDYVLVAEFDIEKGSIVSHQYPSQTGTETNILAELMLPDGAHNRDQDWTVFFLNQVVPETPVRKEQKKEADRGNVKKLEAYIYQFTEHNQDWEMLGNDKKWLNMTPELISVTEADGTLLRKISKSVNIQYQQMEPLYEVMITEEMALGVRLNDEADEKTFTSFLEEFVKPEPEKTEEQQEEKKEKKEETPASRPFLYVLNLVRTKHIPGVKRGARTKAMAICTQHQHVHIFKPLLLLALDEFFEKPEESVPKSVYDAINNMDFQLFPTLNQQEKKIIRASENTDDKRYFKTKVSYGIDLPMKVPVVMYPDEVGDFSLITLINKFGASNVNRENGVMVLFNALLKQQRVIFLGYGHPAGEVANYVLAACSMASPPLRGFIQRAFPYTNLVNVDNMLSCPGFIAGVTNPRFEDMDKWWDVLLNIETGVVKVNAAIPAPAEPEKHIAQDNDFIAEVLFGIQNHYSEDRIRAKFQEYAQSLVDIAFDDAEYVDDATKKKIVANNQQRVELVKNTICFKNYKNDRDLFRKSRAIVDTDVNRLICRLRVRQSLPEKDVLVIYHDFVSSINTNEQLLEFLSYLPELQGGLYPVAVSLFHPSEKVRRAAVELFSRIEKLKAGSGFIANMNAFLKLGYERNKYLLDKKVEKDFVM